jgi:Rha family phage regulatory protein
MPKNSTLNLVQVKGKQNLFTTSLIVAHEFTKRHSNLLKLIDKGFNSKNRQIRKFTEINYCSSEYVDPSGRILKMYEMTEEGFAELAMSFRGEKAQLIRIRFIQEFVSVKKRLQKLSSPERLAAIQDKREAALPMTDFLLLKREDVGKKTAHHHYANEHLFANRALNGRWESIDESTLDAYEAKLLGKIRFHNAWLITKHLAQKDRKQLMAQFVTAYRLKNQPPSQIEEQKATNRLN